MSDFSERLLTDQQYRDAFDARAASAAAYLVERYGGEAVSVISETVRRWDGAEASRRIELQVGRDLQFNGTVVGALAGLLIYSASELII